MSDTCRRPWPTFGHDRLVPPPPRSGDRRLDVLGALATAAFAMFATAVAEPTADLAVAMPITFLAGAIFVARRRAPLGVLVADVLLITAYALADQPGGPIYATSFFAVANLAHHRPDPDRWLAPVLVATLALVSVQWSLHGMSFHVVPVALLLFLTPKLVADTRRQRALHEQAAAEETGRRLAEERLRIAREVHDVVGHGLAAISLRAGVADHVRERDPDEVHAALAAIRAISRDSLAELKVLLGVLRAAGLDVRLDGDTDTAVPAQVGAATYRIVQEALTNVVRHAGPDTTATVSVLRLDGHLQIEVADDGRTAPIDPRPGGGLTGMRERAEALAGTLVAHGGPRGFCVHATLPVP